jgi:hypothetical protein
VLKPLGDLMNQEEYLKNRLGNQIDWYSRKSGQNQNWFKRLQVITIVAAASIPFLSGYITETTPILKLATGGLGLLVAVITATLRLYQFQENWFEYRSTCESLKHEKYLFLTKSEPYDTEEPFKLLVHRVESLISKENTNWAYYMKAPKKQEK